MTSGRSQHATDRCQQGPVGGLEPGTWDLAAQHAKLVAQYPDVQVLGGPTRLEATITIAVRKHQPPAAGRRIQPTTLDRQPSANPAPPPELHMDRAILVHVVGIGLD